MSQSLLKEQLLEFVEDSEEPFDIDFLVANCNDRFVDEEWIRAALWILEEEGKIIKLDHHYLSTRTLMRRWIRSQEKSKPSHEGGSNELTLSESLMQEIQELIGDRPELGYLDVDEFVRDAIRRFIQQF